MGRFEVDPISAASPELGSDDVTALRQSIAALGQLVPIVMWRGKVIDGRKRLAACEVLGIEPVTVTIPDEATASDYAGALNLLRTHYTSGQRAMYAARLANWPHGGRRNSDVGLVTKITAAALTGTSRSEVFRAAQVRREAAPEVIAAVEHGTVALNVAHQLVRLHPKDKQAAVLSRAIEARGAAKNMPKHAVTERGGPRSSPTRRLPAMFARIVEGLVNTCDVLRPYIDQVNQVPAHERLAWIKDLDHVLTTLRRFRRRIQTEGTP